MFFSGDVWVGGRVGFCMDLLFVFFDEYGEGGGVRIFGRFGRAPGDHVFLDHGVVVLGV